MGRSAASSALPLLLLLHPSLPTAHPGASVAAAPASCVAFDNQLVGRAFPNLPLGSSGATLSGNFYGAGGHVSTLDICLLQDQRTRTVGWNWSRGLTSPQCSEPVCFPSGRAISYSAHRSPALPLPDGAIQVPR